MRRLLIIITILSVIPEAIPQTISSERRLFSQALSGSPQSPPPPAPSLLPSCADSSHWRQLTSAERRETLGGAFRAEMADGCFFDMAAGLARVDRKLFEDSIGTVFASRTGKGRFSLPLFFALFNTNRISGSKPLWAKIADIWSAASKDPPYIVLAEYGSGGNLPIADTLYRALDAAGKIDAHELLRYGRVKSLLGDYATASAIYCRAAASGRGIEHAAVTQIEQLFADADSAVKAGAIDAFRKCVFAIPSVDTAYFRNRIADFCGRQGLFELEIAVLSEYDIASAPAGRKIADAARSHFSARRYRHAANAALAAHVRLDSADRRSNAFVAYQVYTYLGVKDSALLWLSASGVSNRDTRIMTAALNQETGRLQEAAAVIDSLPASLSKDTLIVRQRLFTGELGGALAHTSSSAVSWTVNPRERAFWQVRALIFSGRAADAAPILDTLRFAPAWHAAAEALRFKYHIQKLEDDLNALGLWGRLEYYVYTNDLSAAAELLKKQRLAGESGEMLAVKLCRPLADAGMAEEALKILELVEEGGAARSVNDTDDNIPDFGIKGIPGRDRMSSNEKSSKDKSVNSKKTSRTPEYLYFKAEMLSEAGRREEARAAAQRLLQEFPGDVFAQKARILLMKI